MTTLGLEGFAEATEKCSLVISIAHWEGAVGGADSCTPAGPAGQLLCSRTLVPDL